MERVKAGRNRTLEVDDNERSLYAARLVTAEGMEEQQSLSSLRNKTICADLFCVIDKIPEGVADLIVVDPPYNLNKDFHGLKFKASTDAAYREYLRSWFPKVVRLLKEEGSIYVCGDWRSSSVLQQVMEENVTLLNRITWQREKGRGAMRNWKNGMEDIWFGVRNEKKYYFNVAAVKQKRSVVAPYRSNGIPKDWEETEEGNFRLTYPSNFWDDISIPYWSMPENTCHPTQKPEKLVAKLLLASCPAGGLVFDPFLGSGTTSVVAKKLGMDYIGIEINEEYALWAEKRIDLADTERAIQGYVGGVFWERNTLNRQLAMKKKEKSAMKQLSFLYGAK
jgi:site-specific DNA-methyltransferase (adenine-specific)